MRVTALDRHSRCSQVQQTPVVHWDKHALRLNAHKLCKYATRMALFYQIQIIAPLFWSVPVGPDRPCWTECEHGP